MIRGRLILRWASVLIVMLLASCDNVEWGGANVAIVPPPTKADEVDEDLESDVVERLPTGPILYYVRPMDGRATLVPVAEILRDTVRPIQAAADWDRYGQLFIAEHMRQGAEFALFRHGARVGTFVLESAHVPDETVCPRVPQATGLLEFVSDAEEIPEFLALGKAHTPPGAPREVIEPPAISARARTVSPILAERLLRARGASLPSSWSRAMAQFMPFPLADSEVPAFASTFVIGDSLGTGPVDDGHSLFFVAEPLPQVGYDTVYAAFVDYETEEKAAPRVVDYLDWDQDGQPDLLLEVYGTHGSWFEILQTKDGQWRRLLQNPCAPLDSQRPEP